MQSSSFQPATPILATQGADAFHVPPAEDIQRTASVFHASPIGTALVSRQGQFLQVNPALCQMLGYSEAELLSINIAAVTHPEDVDADLMPMRQLLEGAIDRFQLEKRYRTRHGQWIWGLLNVSTIWDAQGRALYFIAQILDITARRHAEEELRASERLLKARNQELFEANQELEKQAHDDGLTGLKNRRSFDERLREEVARSRRTKVGFSLILLDIDQFKEINEKLGHATGDEVLRQMAGVLKNTLRRADTVARFDGEEFALILPSTGALGSFRAAERCLEAIAAHPWNFGPVTASCGVVTWVDEDEQAIVESASQALQSAKEKGPNRSHHPQFDAAG